jgi:hypothetical protein
MMHATTTRHRFAELAQLIDPNGEPKTDKPTILGDAIKFVKQLRAENHQVKQLNKFLEERVAAYERERGQQLYQHMMVQHGMHHPAMHHPAGPAAGAFADSTRTWILVCCEMAC